MGKDLARRLNSSQLGDALNEYSAGAATCIGGVWVAQQVAAASARGLLAEVSHPAHVGMVDLLPCGGGLVLGYMGYGQSNAFASR